MDQKPGTPLLAKALPFGFDAEVTFAEPWEAKAFAIVVKLAEAGHFTGRNGSSASRRRSPRRPRWKPRAAVPRRITSSGSTPPSGS